MLCSFKQRAGEGVPNMLLYEPIPEDVEGASLPLTVEECLRGSRSHMCQGPEVGVYLAYLRRMRGKQEGGGMGGQ